MYCLDCGASLDLSVMYGDVEELSDLKAVIVWMCPECHELSSVLITQEDLIPSYGETK